jgi:hypothetical protein
MVDAGGLDGPEAEGSPLGDGHFLDENALGWSCGGEFFVDGIQEGVEVFRGFSCYQDGFRYVTLLSARAG